MSLTALDQKRIANFEEDYTLQAHTRAFVTLHAASDGSVVTGDTLTAYGKTLHYSVDENNGGGEIGTFTSDLAPEDIIVSLARKFDEFEQKNAAFEEYIGMLDIGSVTLELHKG